MSEFQWQAIETAPKDGTVILTDDGTCKYDEDYRPSNSKWRLCTLSGFVPSCCEYGYVISEINPVLWQPIPLFPRGE
jgi:hypothetical protein